MCLPRRARAAAREPLGAIEEGVAPTGLVLPLPLTIFIAIIVLSFFLLDFVEPFLPGGVVVPVLGGGLR